MIRDKALFTWLHPAYLDTDGNRTVARTTSLLEGGPNAAIKRLLRDHRGLPEEHARTAVDWLLNSLTEHPHGVSGQNVCMEFGVCPVFVRAKSGCTCSESMLRGSCREFSSMWWMCVQARDLVP